jgi:hypothetical protein
MEVHKKADYIHPVVGWHPGGQKGTSRGPGLRASYPGEHAMTVSIRRTHDAYLRGLVKHICTKISAKFPGASFEVCTHPTQRGAIIDAHVPPDDDFEVLDLVNPELDELLLTEDIAIYVRALGPLDA